MWSLKRLTLWVGRLKFDIWRDDLSLKSQHCLDKAIQASCSLSVADIGLDLITSSVSI